MKSRLPPPNTLLCDLGLAVLSDSAEQTLRRARVFLYAVSRPERQVAVMLAGYTSELHSEGVFRTSILSGERPFWEWREWRALRPPRDPDLPELIDELEAFVARWEPRALSAVTALQDEEDREEVRELIHGFRTYPSRTWRAKAWIQTVGAMESGEFYEPVWSALVAQGFVDERQRIRETLKTIQDHIRGLPLDASELEDIGRAREEAVPLVQEWLDARRVQLAGLSEVELTIMGLGDLVPPPGFEPPMGLIAAFRVEAKA